MVLAVVALVIPAIYGHVTQHAHPQHLESLSVDISWVLLLTYGASLLFSLKSHRHLFNPPQDGTCAEELEGPGKAWSTRTSLLVLLVAATLVGVVSEYLVHAVGAAGEALGLRKVFMGVIVLAIVGNAAEHSTAVLVAMKGKMDLALGIALGSSLQIALFVAPIVVLAGHFLGGFGFKPIGLEFTILEVVAVMLSVGAVSLLIHDGKTNWFEGLQLLAIYAILAMAFYFV